MNDVYRQIQVRDSLRKIREAERLAAEREAAARERLDSIARADSLPWRIRLLPESERTLWIL